MNQNYDISTAVDYSDEFQYRAALRKMFKMKEIICDDADLDEITRDEMNFDNDSLKIGHEQLYAVLKDNLLFYDLFVKAASFMISEDPEVGFCVLLSYDYLKPFHKILMKHADVGVNDQDYKALYNILYK
jgi:hypothetical protein